MPAARELDLANDADLSAEARRVLGEEAEALRECSDSLDDRRFGAAVRVLAGVQGRVVVTGMGKSGAVGRKFAGTLSSTGTPAYFLHPSEALHGDVGSVMAGDVVCAFSYSGETEELRSLIPALGRAGAPIVAVTSRDASTLGKAAAVVLCCAVQREACPMNLAPTTSTTLMLALGDALALAVMQARRFTASEYALLHPSGSLGRRLLLRVRDVMRLGEDLAVVPEGASLQEAMLAVMRAHAGACLVVGRDGRLAGLVTDGDFRRRFVADHDSFAKPVALAMNPAPGHVPPGMLAAEALGRLREFHPTPGEIAGDAPVLDEAGRPIGMLTLKDLVRAGIAILP